VQARSASHQRCFVWGDRPSAACSPRRRRHVALHLRSHGRPRPMRGRILRNAAAVAQAIIERFANTEAVAFVVSGERWPDGGLRPAVEDLWGAGAVIAHLSDHGWSSSPKTDAARAAYNGSAEPEREALLGCTSRRELVQQGYGSDLTIAAEIYTSVLVPVLKDSRFTETRASSEARKRNVYREGRRSAGVRWRSCPLDPSGLDSRSGASCGT